MKMNHYMWVLSLQLSLAMAAKPMCDLDRGGYETGNLPQWASSIPSLVNRDEKIEADIESIAKAPVYSKSTSKESLVKALAKSLESMDPDTVVEEFYKFISTRMQTKCKVGKWFALHK